MFAWGPEILKHDPENMAGGESPRIFLFPTLTVGLLDFQEDVVLARLEADFSAQPPSVPAVPNHQVSL